MNPTKFELLVALYIISQNNLVPDPRFSNGMMMPGISQELCHRYMQKLAAAILIEGMQEDKTFLYEIPETQLQAFSQQ